MTGNIILYTRAAKISQNTLTMLRKNGHIPVAVDDMDAVRILPMPAPVIPPERLDAVFNAAMAAIATNTSYPQAKFGELLAHALTRKEGEAG